MTGKGSGVYGLHGSLQRDIALAILNKGFAGVLISDKKFNVVDIIYDFVKPLHPHVTKHYVYDVLANDISTFAIEVSFCNIKCLDKECIRFVRVYQQAVYHLMNSLYRVYLKEHPESITIPGYSNIENRYKTINVLYPCFPKYNRELMCINKEQNKIESV